jgi:hypothetical protein
MQNNSEDFGLILVPDNKTEFSKKLRDNFHHFVNLQNIIKQHGGIRNFEQCYFGQSYLMDGMTLDYSPKMYEKQNSLYNITKGKKRIIQVGINTGHSLLIMLLASKEATFDVFDIIQYGYTLPCIAYLNEYFSNRIFFHMGYPKFTLPHFIEITDKIYDLFLLSNIYIYLYSHIDIILKCALSKTNWQSHIVIDNYDYNEIKSICDNYEELHLITTFENISSDCLHPHKIFVHELSLDSMYL